MNNSFTKIYNDQRIIGIGNLCRLISLFLILLTGSESFSQTAFSRGEQNLQITFEDAMKRADAALRAEGYVNLFNQANFIGAYKATHTAVIMCNAAPGGGQWINIVVTSITCDPGIPGAEREHLQAQMNKGGSNNNNSDKDKSGGSIDWNKTASDYRGKNGERFSFTCPVNDYPGHSLYGTDIYTDDSSICTAAAHAGAIPLSGGKVTIEIRSAQNAYQGSSRNGLNSGSWGTWPGSFVIIR